MYIYTEVFYSLLYRDYKNAASHPPTHPQISGFPGGRCDLCTKTSGVGPRPSFSGTSLHREQNKGLTQSEGFSLVLCPTQHEGFSLVLCPPRPLSSTQHLNKYWLRFLSWEAEAESPDAGSLLKALKRRPMLWLVTEKQIFLEPSRPRSPAVSSDHGTWVTCCLLFHFPWTQSPGK